MDLDFDIDAPLEGLFGDIDPVQVMLEDPDLKNFTEDASHLSELNQYIMVPDSNAHQFNEEPDMCFIDQNASHSCSSFLDHGALEGNLPSPLESSSNCSTTDSEQEIKPVQASAMVMPGSSRSQHMPCMVCGRLSKAIHTFGSITCLSCRAFFSRSSKGDKYKLFACVTGRQNCMIDSKSWMSCRWCRYKQCLRAGMRVPEKNDKSNTTTIEPAKSNTTAIEPAKSYNYILDHVTDGLKDLLLSPKASITISDMVDLGRLTERHFQMANKNMCALVKSDLRIFQRFMNFFFKGIPFPLKDQKVVSDYMQYVSSFSVGDEDLFPWHNLTMKDRKRLASENFSLISEFIMLYRLCKFKDIQKDVILVKDSVCVNESTDYVQKIENIFREASEDGNHMPRRGTYDMMFDQNQFPFTERHKKTSMKLAKLGGYGPQESWDHIHGILTCFIIFYTPDFLDLDVPQEVEKIQTAYASLLYRHVKHRHNISFAC